MACAERVASIAAPAESVDVVLAFEDPLRLAGARATIGETTDCRVVWCARTAAEVRAAARAYADVFVFDMALEEHDPGLLGYILAVTTAHVAIYSGHRPDRSLSGSTAARDDPVIVHRLASIWKEARCFITRAAEPEDFVRLIRAVGHGERARAPRGGVKAKVGPAGAKPISERELDVIQHLASGASNKEIACRLGIHRQTVKNHLANIARKTGVSSRVKLAVFALQYGLVRNPLALAHPIVP